MIDNETLKAISDMLDNKLDNKLEPINQRLNNVDQKLYNVDQRLNRVEILLEHSIPKQIQLLEEAHSLIVERLPESREVDELRDRVRTLESVVSNHSKQIAELKRA